MKSTMNKGRKYQNRLEQINTFVKISVFLLDDSLKFFTQKEYVMENKIRNIEDETFLYTLQFEDVHVMLYVTAIIKFLTGAFWNNESKSRKNNDITPNKSALMHESVIWRLKKNKLK